MAIMDIVRKMSQNKKERKAKFKEMEEDFRLQQMLEERQKSSNRRELERIMKEKEEAQIKEALDKIRKQETKANWSGHNSILKQENNILKDEKPILKEKNIFKDDLMEMKLLKGGNSMGFFK